MGGLRFSMGRFSAMSGRADRARGTAAAGRSTERLRLTFEHLTHAARTKLPNLTPHPPHGHRVQSHNNPLILHRPRVSRSDLTGSLASAGAPKLPYQPHFTPPSPPTYLPTYLTTTKQRHSNNQNVLSNSKKAQICSPQLFLSTPTAAAPSAARLLRGITSRAGRAEA